MKEVDQHCSSQFESIFWEFPSGLVVKTSAFHCRGHGFDPWLGTRILLAFQLGQKKKKEKNLKAFSNCSYQLGGLELSLQSETKRKVKSDCPCITIGLFEAMNAVVSLKPYDVDELASLWV